MTTLNHAAKVYLGTASATAVYAGTTKVWPSAPADYSGVILATPGLVAYWRLGEASGLPRDAKGTNHASAFGGTPGYGTPGAVPGDTAIHFDGSDWFIVPDAAALNFGDFPLTIEFWLKRASVNTTEVFLSKGNQFEGHLGRVEPVLPGRPVIGHRMASHARHRHQLALLRDRAPVQRQRRDARVHGRDRRDRIVGRLGDGK